MSATAAPLAPPTPTVDLDDAPHPSGDDRFAIYSINPLGNRRKLIAETSLVGIGTTLATLRSEGQITNDSRIGIRDRQERIWLVNPWGSGDAS